MLVVVGIIAILIGFLVPVLSRARAAQRSVSCLMTLRQIGTAFKLYAQDNKMRLPDPIAVGKSWEQLLAPYHQAPFRCPSDEELFPAVGSSYDWRDTFDVDTSVAGMPLSAVKRSDLVLAFEALSGWHQKHKINVVFFEGSARTIAEEACFSDLENAVDPTIPRQLRKRR